jgi:hypothetical protein
MSDSLTIINGGGKYRVTVCDDPASTDPNKKQIKVVTNDGISQVVLGFDSMDALIEFQSEMTTATIKYASGGRDGRP